MIRRKRRATTVVAMAGIAASVITGTMASAMTTDGRYLQGVPERGWTTTTELSVGDRVPRTSDPGEDYQMVGIPDGMGLTSVDGVASLFVSHEFAVWNTGAAGNPTDDVQVRSEPVIGGAPIRGAFVSRFVLDDDRAIASGDLAFTDVYQDGTYVGPIATTENTTPAFGRFCSAFLADARVGFDTPIYLANEESDAVFDGRPGTFDPAGGQTVAIVDAEAHALSALGRFPKEASIVAPGTGEATVIVGFEDGPQTPDSQLWMYVGGKDPTSRDVLERNGLVGGMLSVFVANNATLVDEGSFSSGSLHGHWVEIPGAASMDEAELEAAADAAGAFGFVRLEDGAFDPSSPRDLFFVTTGDSTGPENKLGRVYHLRMSNAAPTAKAKLRVVVNADSVVGAGGDTVLSGDNLDVAGGSLLIQEDGTGPSRRAMQAAGREGSIWRFRIVYDQGGASAHRRDPKRIAELVPGGRADTSWTQIQGTWESSGIIDASEVWGQDVWLVNVQAHRSSIAPWQGVVEDGQILVLARASA